MLYRILTENKDRPGIESIVAQHTNAFTTYTATGFWHRHREPSLVIEVDAAKAFEPTARAIAQEIKVANEQESVALQILETEFNLI